MPFLKDRHLKEPRLNCLFIIKINVDAFLYEVFGLDIKNLESLNNETDSTW
jgi:hypothetical protein